MRITLRAPGRADQPAHFGEMGNSPGKQGAGASAAEGDGVVRKLDQGNSPAKALAIFERRSKKADEALSSGDAARAKEKAAGLVDLCNAWEGADGVPDARRLEALERAIAGA